MIKIKAYDKYQKVNVEIQPTDDEIDLINWSSSSHGTFGGVHFEFHSPDIEDYELKRWSDLENILINK